MLSLVEWQAAGAGFLLGLSLIVAIGAQNAFVLKQGLSGQHVYWVVFLCASADALLIAIGVSGFYWLEAVISRWVDWVRALGALYLLGFGLYSLHQAWYATASLKAAEQGQESAFQVMLITLAFTFLNPHVYLDTVLLLGSAATAYGPYQLYFALGAMTASVVFFSTLGFGARLLQPWFARPNSWRWLNLFIGLTMLVLSWQLLKSLL